MKRFVKQNAFALVALLFLGVADAWGLGINKTVALDFKAGNDCQISPSQDRTKISWNGSGNLCSINGWNHSNLSQYDKMVIDVANASRNTEYRVVVTIDGAEYTWSGKGDKTIDVKNDFKDNNNKTPEAIKPNAFAEVESIKIGGGLNSKKGDITIKSITFHKPLEWDAQGQITFYAPDFNLGTNVTAGNPSNNFTFSTQYADISLDFDSDGLATTDIESVTVNISGSGTYQCFQDKERKERVDWGESLISRYNLNDAQEKNINLGRFMICAGNDNVNITFNSVTFTKKKYVFDVTKDRLYFEDFEHRTQASLLSEDKAPAANARPDNNQVGKYYLYGGRGKILKDPTFNNYYQNLADADEYTKSLSENFLRYIFTDAERSANEKAFKASGAATIGFWVNGQVAVDYELPLERGSMFCIFSNDCFAKADAGNVREKDRPRFMFDLSCNGWVYSYMPNTNAAGTDIGMNYFFYGEKIANSGVPNPLGSLFGKDNYTHTLDQSQHKFYDDKKWHYVTYVMDKKLTRVQIYLDGVLTGTVEDVTKLPNTDQSECEFSGDNDYIGRTLYLRNIVLGGLTPHGLFYDQQYYSDAALAYDDIALYGRALTQDEIRSIIEQKNYTPNEWHYGDSFKEYNEIKGGHEEENNVSGLGVNPTFDSTTKYLKLNGGTTLTIPSVPKNYYVRIEYAYANKGDGNAFPGTVGKLSWIGSRVSENNLKLKKTFDGQTYYVRTYQAEESGTYTLNITKDVIIRSIIITPYEYAKLKYGNWNEDKSTFTALSVNKKYVQFDVQRIDGRNFYKKDGKELGENPVLPEVTLVKDGRSSDGKPAYEDINNYREDLNKYPYIKYTSTAPHVAHINKSGKITMTGIAGNTTIIAELISDNQFVGSEVIDSFEIRILKEENTLRLVNRDRVSVNQKFPGVNSNKKLDNITLTIGGWDHTESYTIPGVEEPEMDMWTRAKTFQGPIKTNEEILDDFNQYSRGRNVAKSESLGYDDGEFHPGEEFANNITPWTLPCRGAYVKFEPLKPGIVTMYLLQAGNLDDRDHTIRPMNDGHSTHVYWRPVYITDEKGQVVDFVQTATNGRITYEDNFFVGDKRRAQFIESIAETYNRDASLRQDLLNLRDNDYAKFRTLIDNWNNAGWRQKVIPTGDGGYMVMSEAIVRYTFNVYPGKTYYLFSNQSQVAISGFNFEEGRLLDTKTQNYETAPVRDVVESTPIEFTDVLNQAQPEIPTNGKGKDITHVTYERNFAQGKWSSICLPFSLNNRQMREQFGEETAVVLLKSIHDDGKIELIWHVNQDIIAGYPYFILPKGAVKHNNVANSTITKISVDTYFNNEIQKDKPLFSVGSNGNTFDWQGTYNGSHYRADYPYVFEGNFKNEELPAGSYVMSNNGTLTKLKKATIAKPFRAYLKYQGSDANNAKPLYTSVNWQNDDETTGIDDIIFQNGILMESSDVYSIDGTVIRRDAQNLSNLSKGVYIVNGKKFVVK